ncbi:MAG: hypothetical protein OXB90_02040 [Acidimicrobiaceae bacterium]|nr:hypothetical protein [Acidimicrobiaceae bacterium]
MVRLLLLAVFLFFALGCSGDDRVSDRALSELKLGTLPSGVEIFGSRPNNGALLLFEGADFASWVVFFDNETCVLDIERSVLSTRSEPVVELGRDDLVSSVSCNPPDWVHEKGLVATGEDYRQTIISAVLPRVYCSNSWTLGNTEQLSPFGVLAKSPYSVHLIAPNSEVLEAQEVGALGSSFDVQIRCECGDRAMRALI